MPEKDQPKLSPKAKRELLDKTVRFAHQLRAAQSDLTHPIDLAQFLLQHEMTLDQADMLFAQARKFGFPLPQVVRPEPIISVDDSQPNGNGQVDIPSEQQLPEPEVERVAVDRIEAPAIIHKRPLATYVTLPGQTLEKVIADIRLRRRMQPTPAEFEIWMKAPTVPLQSIHDREGRVAAISSQVGKELYTNLDDYIVTEDDDVLVLDKPPFLLSQGSQSVRFGAEEIVRDKRDKQLTLVNRLDGNTSGLLLFAKTADAFLDLKGQFFDKRQSELIYQYLVLMQGRFANGNMVTVDIPIAEAESGKVRLIQTDRDRIESAGAPIRDALTTFEPIARFSPFDQYPISLARAESFKGVRHDIRAVAAMHLEMPLIGDAVYNPRFHIGRVQRQMMHGSDIRFWHPQSGEVVAIHSKPPTDFADFLAKLVLEERYKKTVQA